MNNKKILVTGANGYLGVEIVKAILDMGNEVIATDVKVDNVDDRAEKKYVIFLKLKIHMNTWVNQMYYFI